MPEGDTIHRSATRLSRALAGKRVTRFVSGVSGVGGGAAALGGRALVSVEARGKHLAMRFDDGHVLLTHMRMTGSWHIYRPGERWWLPEHTARVVIEVEASKGDEALVAVCFAAPVVRLVRAAEAERDLARLGPDVVAEAFAPDDAVTGLRALGGERAIGEALLEQRALAGIGNVYKSEVLFAEKISPFSRIADLDDATLTALVARARVLMRRNLASAERRTTTSGLASSRYAVYGRSKRPCPRCGAPIVRVVQGRDARSTYYCPRCQPAGRGVTSPREA